METRYDMQMMVQVAKLYYLDGLTQQNIAKQLGISRSYISMILSEARDLGIVEINIKNPLSNNDHMANEVKRLFDLQSCYVIPTGVTAITPLTKIVAAQGVVVAEELIDSHATIGVAWGMTCYEFMTAFTNSSGLSDVNVVPLIGGSHRLSSEYQLNEMVRMFSEKLNGTPSFIYAPALAETLEDKELYMKSQYMKSIIEKWSNLDLAVISVGAPSEFYSSKGQFDPVMMRHIYEESADKSVGDISARRFNIHGEFINNEYNDKIMGIDERNLRNTKNVLCIAAGNHKILSIIGALKLNVITHLITDENTATGILDLVKTEN